MELHPLLSQLDNTDLERYMNACKEDLINFLEDLGLNNNLALQMLEDVRASLSWKTVFFLMAFRQIVFPGGLLIDLTLRLLFTPDVFQARF